jgi:hypothetical protein
MFLKPLNIFFENVHNLKSLEDYYIGVNNKSIQ